MPTPRAPNTARTPEEIMSARRRLAAAEAAADAIGPTSAPASARVKATEPFSTPRTGPSPRLVARMRRASADAIMTSAPPASASPATANAGPRTRRVRRASAGAILEEREAAEQLSSAAQLSRNIDTLTLANGMQLGSVGGNLVALFEEAAAANDRHRKSASNLVGSSTASVSPAPRPASSPSKLSRPKKWVPDQSMMTLSDAPTPPRSDSPASVMTGESDKENATPYQGKSRFGKVADERGQLLQRMSPPPGASPISSALQSASRMKESLREGGHLSELVRRHRMRQANATMQKLRELEVRASRAKGRNPNIAELDKKLELLKEIIV